MLFFDKYYIITLIFRGVIMNLLDLIFYFIFGLILFFILNYLDKSEEENNIVHAIIPVIYIVLLSGIITALSLPIALDNLFFIILFELLIRIYYVRSILRQDELMNTSYYTQIYAVSIVLGYFVNKMFILEVESVFPTVQEMKLMVWFLIIVFLYFTFKNHIHIQVKEQKKTFPHKKKQYILVQYVKLKTQYHQEIKMKKKEYLPLFYAMMIYTNYQRPLFYRKIDQIVYRFTGKETKMGIMQIPSRVEIQDRESIRLAVQKLEKIIDKMAKTRKKNIIPILETYYENSEMALEVQEIYQEIVSFEEK